MVHERIVSSCGCGWCGVNGMDRRVECRVEWDDMGWEGMVSFIVISFVQAQFFTLSIVAFSGSRLDGSVRCWGREIVDGEIFCV